MKKTAKNKKRGIKSRKIILVSVCGVVLVGGGVFASLLLMDHLRQKQNDETSAQNINYESPTDEQIEAGQNIKAENAQKNEQEEIGKTEREIFITDASQYDGEVEVRAFIEGATEGGGSCVFSFANGSQTLTRSSEAVPGAAVTTCSTITVPASEFPASGSYVLTISYNSENVTAISDGYTVEVKK